MSNAADRERDDPKPLLRDYFAGQAMQVLIPALRALGGVGNATQVMARRAYEIADAMLEARKR